MAKGHDPYYDTAEWRALRAAVRERCGGICEVPGCYGRMAVADHIVARKAGGADALSNLRGLCKLHDNQVMQRDGHRKRGGKFRIIGADRNGDPLAGWAVD